MFFLKKNGTGGKNTNLHGLKFEKETDLSYRIQKDLGNKYRLQEHEPHIKSTSPVYDVIRLKDNKRIGVLAKQLTFYPIMKELYGLDNVNKKRWKPDEAFFNLETNTVYIVEKKWQNGNGSVDEKIFGFVNKRRLYQNNFNQLEKEPKVTVQFCALFNKSWWLQGNNGKNEKAYQDYFDNLRIDGIKIFFDNYDYWWFGL